MLDDESPPIPLPEPVFVGVFPEDPEGPTKALAETAPVILLTEAHHPSWTPEEEVAHWKGLARRQSERIERLKKDRDHYKHHYNRSEERNHNQVRREEAVRLEMQAAHDAEMVDVVASFKKQIEQERAWGRGDSQSVRRGLLAADGARVFAEARVDQIASDLSRAVRELQSVSADRLAARQEAASLRQKNRTLHRAIVSLEDDVAILQGRLRQGV